MLEGVSEIRAVLRASGVRVPRMRAVPPNTRRRAPRSLRCTRVVAVAAADEQQPAPAAVGGHEARAAAVERKERAAARQRVAGARRQLEQWERERKGRHMSKREAEVRHGGCQGLNLRHDPPTTSLPSRPRLKRGAVRPPRRLARVQRERAVGGRARREDDPAARAAHDRAVGAVGGERHDAAGDGERPGLLLLLFGPGVVLAAF